ncbi:tetraacyldisaccharide 4'-kinase [Pseudomaricurvus sp. HS19]|uniref:tetraacyldisaccharide 4'-kinase n=1 Tax=Pseudomaricurvus sp. HS19 TaxID=2692626 RepID=UPI00136CA345|nr:tetraacyldisaccharide 4'-kinase [Pseudomaricurvus sp. HS19]MYM62698.1 tetraacyldisaccharide 4'-kinase [Pseudomaricurvus sp. HS19]
MTAGKTPHTTQEQWLDRWYQGRWWLWLLWPLSLLFRLVAAVRRRQQEVEQASLPVPVVVVGNITLGGTGKTPVIITLVQHLRERGWKPGVVSRGYGGQAPQYPYLVTPDSDPRHSGDEPLLIALSASCPVAVDANRLAAAELLVAQGCNILLSDDGLQHYKLPRQWELCLLDGQRGWGNGLCLPAGPLREPVSRLAEVQAILLNGDPDERVAGQLQNGLPAEAPQPQAMHLQPLSWHRLVDDTTLPAGQLPWDSVSSLHAVTGIGNPGRFFHTLQQLGLEFSEHVFPDHHPFSPADFDGLQGGVVLMTAKDAVKCREFAGDNFWYLAVAADLPEELLQKLDADLQ